MGYGIIHRLQRTYHTSKRLTMTNKEAIEWVLNTNMELSKQYRCDIEREIWHTRRIYGSKLSDEVKRMLKQSIKEINVPSYPKPPCRESVAAVFNKVPRLNFMLIRAEYLSVIDSL
jgi:hypothetical protein